MDDAKHKQLFGRHALGSSRHPAAPVHGQTMLKATRQPSTPLSSSRHPRGQAIYVEPHKQANSALRAECPLLLGYFFTSAWLCCFAPVNACCQGKPGWMMQIITNYLADMLWAALAAQQHLCMSRPCCLEQLTPPKGSTLSHTSTQTQL